jgi:thiamine pyrophosphokinase
MNLPTAYLTHTEWTLIGPMGPQLPEWLSTHPRIGVDGGAHFSSNLDLWVGDADSFTSKVSAKHCFQYPKEKSSSDLALAFKLFSSTLPYRLHLWGFLGGREDHQLFNLGEAFTFLQGHPGAEILLYGPNAEITFHILSQGSWSFDHQGTFSLGALKEVEVGLSGECKYPINFPSMLPPLSSLGLSNEASGTVKLETSGPVFIYFSRQS